MGKRRKSRSESNTLLTTFLFGFCIGCSLLYALVAFLEVDFSGVEEEVLVESSGGALASFPEGVDGDSSGGEIGERASMASGSVGSILDDEVDLEEVRYADVGGVWPGRHLFLTVPGTVLDDATRELLSLYKPGGVVLRGENFVDESQTRRLVDDIKDAVGLGSGYADGPFIAVSLEEVAGSGFGLSDMPSAWELGVGGDADRVEAVAGRYAASVRRRGIGVVLGPSLNVYRPGLSESGRKDRFFGDNVGVVASVGLAFSEGLRAGGILSVVGLYPGLGAATRKADGSLAILDNQMTLAEEVIFPFARAADGNVAGLMVGHIAVPVLDKDSPERPASLSPKLVQTLLRDLWSYEGLALADDVTLDATLSGRSVVEVVVEALLAGCDAVLLYELDRDELGAICRAVVERSAVNNVFRERLIASKERLSNHLGMLAVPVSQPAGTDRVLHAIRRGENLTAIARKYRVDVEDVMAWNGLSDTDIRFGQRLSIYVPRAETAAVATLDSDRAETAVPEDVVALAAQESEMVPEAVEAGALEGGDDVGDGGVEEGVVDDEKLEAAVNSETSGGGEAVEEEGGAQTGVDSDADEKPLAEIAPTTGDEEVVEGAGETQAAVDPGVAEEPLEEIVPTPGGDDVVEGAGETLAEVGPGVAEEPLAEIQPASGGDEVLEVVGESGGVKIYRDEDVDPGVVDGSIETTEPVTEDGAAEIGTSEIVVPSEGTDGEALETSASTQVAVIEREHVVAEGETVAGIALSYGVTEEVLRSWNKIEGDILEVGRALVVYLPAEGTVEEEKAFGYYTIEKGDILHNVAVKLGTTKVMLMKLNGLTDANLIKIGQRLKYPMPSE